MTTVADIIRQALREANSIGVGAVIPAPEHDEALARLQALVLSALGTDVGYIMEDWNLKAPDTITKPSGVPLTAGQAAAFTAPPNSRFICALTGATTLLLDPLPQDGQRVAIVDAIDSLSAHSLTISPNGRKIEAATASVVLNTSGTVREWFYRSDTANWTKVATLSDGDPFPFPGDFDDYFTIMLAARLNPRYGRELGDASQHRLTQQSQAINARYSQSRLAAPSPAAAPTQG